MPHRSVGNIGIARSAGQQHDGAGRLQRAQKNLFETLPLFIAAVLIAHLGGRDGALTGWGVALYFWARVVYLPLYAFGIPYVRSLVWLVSLAGLILVIVADLHG